MRHKEALTLHFERRAMVLDFPLLSALLMLPASYQSRREPSSGSHGLPPVVFPSAQAHNHGAMACRELCVDKELHVSAYQCFFLGH